MSRTLSENERRIWLKVARSIRPLSTRSMLQIAAPDPQTTEPHPSESRSTVLARNANSRSHHKASIPEAPFLAKPPLKSAPTAPTADISGQRRLRRGQTPVDARLDLHGHSQVSAQQELIAFVHREAAHGARCLLIITGKGRSGSGVLRQRFFEWIDGPELRPLLAGYSVSHARHGGEGAFYLLLKSRTVQSS